MQQSSIGVRIAVVLGFASIIGFAASGGAQQSQPQPTSTPLPGVSQSGPKPLEIPANERPPKGMCRNWIDNVPAERQPAVTDCATALKTATRNERTIFGDDYAPQPAKPTKPVVHPTVPTSQSTTVPAATFPPVKPPLVAPTTVTPTVVVPPVTPTLPIVTTRPPPRRRPAL